MAPSSKHSNVDDDDYDASSSTGPDIALKLFRILEDASHPQIIHWSPGGDKFVIADAAEFTKVVLPTLFRHANYSSFVRQLNKYDFHKVKNADPAARGVSVWTFRHIYFQAKKPELLSKIKRKLAPGEVKKAQGSQDHGELADDEGDENGYAHKDSTSTPELEALYSRLRSAEIYHESTIEDLKAAIEQKQETHKKATNNFLQTMQDIQRQIDESLESTQSEIRDLQRRNLQQDLLLRNLMQYFLSPSASLNAPLPMDPSLTIPMDSDEPDDINNLRPFSPSATLFNPTSDPLPSLNDILSIATSTDIINNGPRRIIQLGEDVTMREMLPSISNHRRASRVSPMPRPPPYVLRENPDGGTD